VGVIARGARSPRWWPTAPQVPGRRPAGEVLLRARGVRVVHGGHVAVDGVDLEVRAGELVALVGPNGAGKSSLLRALSGDHHSGAAGRVTVDGVALADWAPGDLARRRAVLPQAVAVGFPFTGDEVVAMGRAPWARTAEAELDDVVVASALAELECTHLADQPVTTMSGGERARVALARVLAQSAQLLLLDEPTAALDLHHAEHVLAVLRRRTADGDAVVVVVHDLGAAAAHADRIVLLDAGRVVADGPVTEVLTPDLLSRTYRHPIDVLAHPRTGAPVVVPDRAPRPSGRAT
jgi:iron complex transport system ATP-binding protein